MSQHIQRLAVRMLYDPSLVIQVYTGVSVDGLSDAERAILTASPQAAWGTDPLRPTRTLQALLEEFPVSAAVTGLSPLHGFFTSEDFHRCIQKRGRLVASFGGWMVAHAGRIAELELAIARSRRDPIRASGSLSLVPGLVPVSLPEDTLSCYQKIRASLGPDPLKHLISNTFRPYVLPEPPENSAHFLIERGADGGVQIGGGSAALNGLLAAAPAPRSVLEQAAIRQGATAAEAPDIIDDLLREGLLECT
ncbi:MAG: hypothetical protein P8R54_31635 [Myxococcota bacterium]|nr:hypothetical protein [Myxococcota bacterium]